METNTWNHRRSREFALMKNNIKTTEKRRTNSNLILRADVWWKRMSSAALRRCEQTILWSGLCVGRYCAGRESKQTRTREIDRRTSKHFIFFSVTMKYIVIAATPTEHFTIIGRHSSHCSWRLAQPEPSFELDGSSLIAHFAESVWRNAVMAKTNIQKDGTMSTWDAFDFLFPAPPIRAASAKMENTAKTMTLTTISCQKLKFPIPVSIEYCFFALPRHFISAQPRLFYFPLFAARTKVTLLHDEKKGQPILV